MRGVVGGGDEAEEEEDEVGHAEDAGELLVQDLLPVRHLLLRVPPEPVPPDHPLQRRQKQGEPQEWDPFILGVSNAVLPATAPS